MQMSSQVRKNIAAVGMLLLIDALALGAAFSLAFITREFFNRFRPDAAGLSLTLADVSQYWWTPFVFFFLLRL